MFDFNGVIMDDYDLQKESWSGVTMTLRGSLVSDEEMVAQIRGIPTRDNVRRMAADAGKPLSEAEILQYEQQKEDKVRDLYEKSPLTKLASGLTDLLDQLKQKQIPITIASSSDLKNLQIIFDRFHLDAWFDLTRIIHGHSTLNGMQLGNKPLPDPYIAAAQILGVSPSDCVVFEDAKSGIQSAYDAGVRSIVAINSQPKHLALLTTMPGVIKGIHDFTDTSAEELFSKN